MGIDHFGIGCLAYVLQLLCTGERGRSKGDRQFLYRRVLVWFGVSGGWKPNMCFVCPEEGAKIYSFCVLRSGTQTYIHVVFEQHAH